VKDLIEFLRKNLILDFQGELTTENLRAYLKNDDSREAKLLLAKVVSDGDTNDMMLVLADCLLEVVQGILSDDAVRNQLRIYADS
jgi:hypothetical protein